MAAPVNEWFYMTHQIQDGDPVQVMRYRVGASDYTIETTSAGGDHWRQVNDLAHVLVGVDDDNWTPVTEEDARAAVPEVTWFDDEATETVPMGTYEWPEIPEDESV